jgi:transposase
VSDFTTHVGLDVHKSSIVVTLLKPGTPEGLNWQEPNDEPGVRRLIRRLRREVPGELLAAYEAGPCGYALQRQLKAEGIPCQLIAPSLIPRKPGERVKTDRRDARKLAELLRAGLLTEVHPPSEADEAVRDFCRCREDARHDLTRARHRLGKFLLRRHRGFAGSKRAWGTKYMNWLRTLRFEHPADQATFDSYLLTVDQRTERLHQLEHRLTEFAGLEPYREPVGWLRCFRGIDTVTALSIVTELHGFHRFPSPRSLMTFLGLVPSEYSSGNDRRQGSITRCGNNHVRRLLVEAAWHHRHRPTISRPLELRRHGQPTRVIAIANKAQERLHQRFHRMAARGKPYNKAIIAMARELAGYIWVVLYPDGVTSATATAR